MGKAHKPRQGSMQFWPRKRAETEVARVRSWTESKDVKPLGFAGYKVGMTHVMITDTKKVSSTKGMKVRVPVTVVECPNLKVIGARFYKKGILGTKVVSEVEFASDNKRLSKRKNVAKKADASKLDSFADKLSDFSDVRMLVHTLPSQTSIGKKTPEVFEMGVGGSVEDKFNYIKENAGKEFSVADVFEAGSLVDLKGVTKGKGFQGPVKRFGVSIRARKSEKTKRGPGSISGGWVAAGHMMYRVAHAGQMGYHTRTEYNKVIMKISDNPEDVNPKGGFINYGVVKSTFILVKGSVLGPKKRLIKFTNAIRPNKKYVGNVPAIESISIDSKQGN